MFDLWADLPAWLRLIAAMGLIGAGGAVVIVGAGLGWVPMIGFGMAATGLVLVLVGGKSNAEKNGYHF